MSEGVKGPSIRKVQTVFRVLKRLDPIAPLGRLAALSPLVMLRQLVKWIRMAASTWLTASNWFTVPICGVLAIGIIAYLYQLNNSSGNGEPFAWFEGISAWPSIAIILFAAVVSVHFLFKMDFSLWQNADELTENFGLIGNMPEQAPFFGWEAPKLVSGISSASPLFRGLEIELDKRIDITALWQSYLCRGKLWTRLKRAAPMMVLYILALTVVLPFFGHFPHAQIRGRFPFPILIMPTIILFLLLTFVVLDAILLHEGFLRQLVRKETYWPDDTFKRLEYSIIPNRPPSERDLADYWDISLIARRTEAVGNIVYYPFAILSLLIVARLSYFDNWTWTPPLIVALCLHFCLAFYAAWRLPKIAKEYRDIVLRRLKRRRRQALMQAERTPEAIDTMIEEVQSTHQGAFSYLWEQPAIRALLFPSGGIGLATLLQYLQH
jgi:hypothetical protein